MIWSWLFFQSWWGYIFTYNIMMLRMPPILPGHEGCVNDDEMMILTMIFWRWWWFCIHNTSITCACSLHESWADPCTPQPLPLTCQPHYQNRDEDENGDEYIHTISSWESACHEIHYLWGGMGSHGVHGGSLPWRSVVVYGGFWGVGGGWGFSRASLGSSRICLGFSGGLWWSPRAPWGVEGSLQANHYLSNHADLYALPKHRFSHGPSRYFASLPYICSKTGLNLWQTDRCL